MAKSHRSDNWLRQNLLRFALFVYSPPVADDDPTIDSKRNEDPLATSKPESDETLDLGTSHAKPEIRMRTVETIGDYDVESEIARGGMGVVYKARHKTLNRTVALKMILSGQFASAADVRRFHQEAEAAANLDHSGIVPIYDIGEHEGQHYFSMKFIEGGSLAERLPALRVDRKQTVQLIAKIARAMHHAHQRGILHRDLKPANILLDEAGNPLVSDLGLAKQIKSESDLTHTGAVVGTPAYMPPEQAAAKKEITTAADIYSLGAILYEALTGQPPHKGESPVVTMMQVLNDEIIRPRQLDRSVDRVLELICLKCLEKDPNDRYTSAAALAEDLESWAAGKPVSVKRPSLGSSLTQALVSNTRSVIGAGMIGVVAGIALAYYMSFLNSNGVILDNPPELIYSQLPGEIPFGRNVVFQAETKRTEFHALLALLGTFSTLGFVGWFVARLTRPKPGSEALAMAMITSIMMSIALFNFHISFGGIASESEEMKDMIEELATIALGEESESNAAREALAVRHPQLGTLPPSERAKVLSYRVYYDTIFVMPAVIWAGIASSLIMCTIPVLFGTTFGSKLIHQNPRIRRSLFVYFEFMMLLIILGFLVFLQTFLPYIDANFNAPNLGLRDAPARQLFVYPFMAMMATMIYSRRVRWYWRLLLYFGFLVTCNLLP